MQLFLSWSGPQSKAIAEALRDWIPLVINAVQPWMSSEIEKGRKWSPEISATLEATSFGIICLTRTNLHAPWILFEAGALSKTKDARVSTFLYGLTPAEVEQPLGQFQHTLYEEGDVLKLLRSINLAVREAGEPGLQERAIEKSFSALWPILKQGLDSAAAIGQPEKAEIRTDREILEEILELQRAQARTAPAPFKDLADQLVSATYVAQESDRAQEPSGLWGHMTPHARVLLAGTVAAVQDENPGLQSIFHPGPRVGGVAVVARGSAERLERFTAGAVGAFPERARISQFASRGQFVAFGLIFLDELTHSDVEEELERAATKAGVQLLGIRWLRKVQDTQTDPWPELARFLAVEGKDLSLE